MVFIETPIFTKQVKASLSDDAYGQLQQHLANDPKSGDLVKGSGGIRKVRWALPGKGKSGGIRAMYYWQVKRDQIFMLFLFSKGERSDLTDAQLKDLAKVVKELK